MRPVSGGCQMHLLNPIEDRMKPLGVPFPTRAAVTVLSGWFMLAACSREQATRASPIASASGAPTAASAQATAVAASASAMPPIEIPDVTWARTYHGRRVQGECIFDFDAPEPLQPAKNPSCIGPTCFVLESKSFELAGSEGSQLYSEPHHALDMFKGQYRDVLRSKDNGVLLAIVLDPKKEGGDKHGVSGSGGEPYRDQRILGCEFGCAGPRDRLGDVVKFCKSVRITVKAKKK